MHCTVACHTNLFGTNSDWWKKKRSYICFTNCFCFSNSISYTTTSQFISARLIMSQYFKENGTMCETSPTLYWLHILYSDKRRVKVKGTGCGSSSRWEWEMHWACGWSDRHQNDESTIEFHQHVSPRATPKRRKQTASVKNPLSVWLWGDTTVSCLFSWYKWLFENSNHNRSALPAWPHQMASELHGSVSSHFLYYQNPLPFNMPFDAVHMTLFSWICRGECNV